MACVDAALAWISVPDDSELSDLAHEHASSVAIIDATNTTKARRRAVLDRCLSAVPLACGVPLRVVFLESICDDPAMLESNYHMKLKNDDYKHVGKDEESAALADFRDRVKVRGC